MAFNHGQSFVYTVLQRGNVSKVYGKEEYVQQLYKLKAAVDDGSGENDQIGVQLHHSGNYQWKVQVTV